MVRIVPLGGLGEIGLNCMAVEAGSELLLVDAGLLFPGEDMPGVDYAVPDFGYVRERAAGLRGVLLTHGHEDHVGALPALLRELPVPVYGTPFTLGLARQRLDELGIAADLREIEPGRPFPLGEAFSAEAVRTCHSTPDAVGYLIETPEGAVVHTGDYKVDPFPPDGRTTDLDRYREAGERGVACLFADSTNSEVVESTGSERTVAEALLRVMSKAEGRVVVSLFASNVVRLQAVLDASVKLGRRVALQGRAMLRNVELGRQLGLLHFPEDLIVPAEGAAHLRALTLLSTGSQAEPRSGLFQLLDEGRPLRVGPEDLVILSSRAIPGNERAIAGLIDALSAAGAQVVHAGPIPDLHVSGHASPDQQRQLICAVRPAAFVPIHGELHHLAAQLATARSSGVSPERALLARDGDVIRLEQGRARIEGRVPAGRIYRDRFGQGAVTPEAIAERVRLAETGVVVASLAYDRSRGRIAGPPSLEGRGLSSEETAALAKAGGPVLEALAEVSPELLADDAFAREELARAVRKVFKSFSPKRPAVIPVIVKL